MKESIWRILVVMVISISIVSYFLLFKSEITTKPILGLPSQFFFGILVTVVLVVLTFIGQSVFPYADHKKLKDE